MRLRRPFLLTLLLPQLCGVVDAVSTASKLIIVTGANSGESNLSTTRRQAGTIFTSVLGP